jgi:hypothetical protein
MTDLQLVVVLQFVLTISLLVVVGKMRAKLKRFDEWADTVDEFIDSQYIELEFEVEDDKNKKSNH